ncbi:DUF2339 domain-containing protein [Neorhodopirellula pilleata]|uniref:ABC-2 family transporter protein n=1 Tax=Neorhodopirellula pilleata TaxID=2714738 RepID=A0A5C6APZ9_9BACT|nr:hypothetical protein [Neorhodopirellula pilleata]TWU02025.1 ABC-2 family transporter protein [Neorhodopirellula pilleata]
MNTSTRWFVWKESCQLLPLVAALVMIVGILWTIQSSMWEVRTDAYYVQLEWTFLILPIVFATGAGSILVGFEREQGTMQWMSMLPMSSRRLIVTKGVVALIGLVVMWCVSAILIFGFGVDRSFASRTALDDPSVGMPGVHAVAWVARSIFVLVVSFYTAWKIANPFLALVALVALMFVPSLIVWTFLDGPEIEIWNGQSREIRLTLAAIAVSTLGFAFVGYRSAVRVLSPTPATRWHPTDILSWIGNTFSGDRSYRFESSFAALLWFSLQNMARVWLIHLGLLTLATVSLFSLRDHPDSIEQNPGVPAMLFGLTASWLGVSVFKFAGSPAAVRPLALIGVSPTRVYLARHAVPLAILSSSIVVYAAIATYLIANRTADNYPLTILPSVLQVGLFAGMAYAISQWLSQVMRTTVLAYFAAPLITLPLLILWSRSLLSVTTLAIWTMVMMAVTWWLMRRYMLGNDRVYGSVSAAVVATIFYFGVIKPPDFEGFLIPDIQTVRLGSDAVGSAAPRTIQIKSKIGFSYGLAADEIEADNLKTRQFLRSKLDEEDLQFISLFENMDRLIESPNAIVQMETPTLGDLFSVLMFERIEYREKANDRFVDSVQDVATLVAGLRRSTRWLDQESADRLEIFIADTLTDPELNLDPSSPTLVTALSRLPTTAERHEARRRAILVSYHDFNSRSTVDSHTLIDGLTIDPEDQSLAGAKGRGTRQSRMRTLVAAALSAIESESRPGEIQPWQITLHEQTVFGAVPFELGPYSDWHRNEVPTIATIPWGFYGESLYPVRYVGLPWEQQIETLRNGATDQTKGTR